MISSGSDSVRTTRKYWRLSVFGQPSYRGDTQELDSALTKARNEFWKDHPGLTSLPANGLSVTVEDGSIVISYTVEEK
jgi:hypothetical protein